MSTALEITTKQPTAVKVFISSLSTSKEAKQQQQRIVLTFDVKKIQYEKKDIAVDPQAKREFRMLMRGYDTKANPPQIFNGDYLCGDYEAFYWAVEDNKLDEFLRLTPPKSIPTMRASELSTTSVTVDASSDKLPTDKESRTNNTPTGDSNENDAATLKSTGTDVSTVAPSPLVAPPLPPTLTSGSLAGGPGNALATPRDNNRDQ